MRGLNTGKHEKTRKSRENTSRKLLTGNTIEQYAGLNFNAASRFSVFSFRESRKHQNRHFLGNEQYGRLESWQARILSIQAARSRASEALDPDGSRGFQGSQMTKSRKLAILASLLRSGKNGPRVG